MKVVQVDIKPASLRKIRKIKPKKLKKPKPRRDLHTMFRRHLSTLDVEKLKKPWMASKAFRLIDTKDALWEWARGIMADKSRYHLNPIAKQEMPVIAVDTENTGLDTRIITIIDENPDGTLSFRYEVNIEVAGLCLSADGIEGIYVPVNHEFGAWVRPIYDPADPSKIIEEGYWGPAVNVSREDVAEVLQWLFDQCHLVFYNAKYDREVIRVTLGINFRGYPFFEDVQVMQYINDPKADLGDRGKYTGDSGGLKSLSANVLGLDQIHSEDLLKVRADFFNPVGNKTTLRVQYAPFTWLPTEVALWYAAADSICTWLLWFQMKNKARERGLVHRIDHELVESLTYLERQRFIVDIAKHKRTVNWHDRMLSEMGAKLRLMALEAGFVEEKNPDGTVDPDNRFNPDSNPQLGKFLFGVKRFKVIRMGKLLPSVDAEVIKELQKQHPEDEFLKLFSRYKAYVALHPESLRFDTRDNSARVYLKQNVVAGGRLAAAGGDFDIDGGFGLNPQGIKRVEGNWWVRGNVLEPDNVPEDQVEEYTEADLHPSCFKEDKGIKKKAPGIVKNHIGNYMGYAICLVPKCTSCANRHGVLLADSRMDANQVVNIRTLMVAPPGFTFFTIDYSNIEMRAAANCSGEPEFIKEFLEGKGDFHSLTASKVFPAFNDPNIDKAVKKALRSLAKIINFALLYGGTEYTIYENMKKEKPDITWDECKDMVAKYWEGVPVFAEFCNKKQTIAREKMTCTTSTGRVIYFKSAMDALGIHMPNESEKDNYWQYRNLQKKEEEAKKQGNEDLAAKCKVLYDRMWKDQTTGVRNYQDYNRFMGKIQRVAVNVPLQGLAGDFMRISLNRIRAWALSNPIIQSVFRLFCSVHDEIDFAVKNEYCPFVLPRLTRLMKLRKYHEKMKWPVPVECDCEYGLSWDVEHHLTGDEGHKPAGWSKVPGMENYIPDGVDPVDIKTLRDAIVSGDILRKTNAEKFLKENLHPRCDEAIKVALAQTQPQAALQAIIIAFQLDEYWKIDHIPDGQDDTMETLEQFEARNGLTAKDRGVMPEMGYLGAIPLTANIKRPTLQVLGKDVPAEDVTIVVSDTEIAVEEPCQNSGPIVSDCEDCHPDHECPGPSTSDEDVIGDFVKKKPVAETISIQPPLVPSTPGAEIPELIDMDATTIKQFKTAMGVGRNKIRVRYQGTLLDLGDVSLTKIPDEFIHKEQPVGA
jgi:DNA polymerase I-like protein with 3'-5' exonuclease and polymerase domains